MLKKVDFVKCADLWRKKSNKKGKKTFIALFLFWIVKLNIAEVSLLWWSIFLVLDKPTLKVRIIIILLTDRLEIILPTARTANKQFSCLRLIIIQTDKKG